MKHKEHNIIISLASNHNAEANLEAARTQLAQLLTELHFTRAIWTVPIDHSSLTIDHSSCGESIPQSTNAAANYGQWSMVNGQCSMYLNQLCSGTTAFGMNLLNEVLKEIEKRLGRTHNEDGIVTLDLDLLEYDGERHHLRDWDRPYVKNLINEL